jgi:RNA polymerase sigma-70 factor, ECF subfamily
MAPARGETSTQIEGAVSEALMDLDVGSRASLPELVPSIYERLRRLARFLLRYEREAHTLQPTAIVNEAFLRLARLNRDVRNRRHCYFLLAKEMRRVLVDYGRRRRRLKRDAPTCEEMEILVGTPNNRMEASIDLLTDVEGALQALGQHDQQAAEMMVLHYMVGLDSDELQAYFRTSEATITRTLRFSRAWVARHMKIKGPGSEPSMPREQGADQQQPEEPHKRCNLADVARLAGVSEKTVWRVVHDSPVVREETRAKVSAALLSTGYMPERRVFIEAQAIEPEAANVVTDPGAVRRGRADQRTQARR